MMAAQNFNVKGSGEKFKRFVEIAVECGAINSGDGREGGCYCGGRDFKFIVDHLRDGVTTHAVFNSQENLTKFLKRLREEDLGVSVVVSGLLQTVHECCAQSGITPHTVNMSLGVHGRTDKLATGKPLDIMTMCGHGMITSDLIWHYVGRIQKGQLTSQEAAMKIGSLCVCGIFNPARCAELFDEIIKEEK
jgi:hypothetical protein